MTGAGPMSSRSQRWSFLHGATIWYEASYKQIIKDTESHGICLGCYGNVTSGLPSLGRQGKLTEQVSCSIHKE
jgi:hypothetical protein